MVILQEKIFNGFFPQEFGGEVLGDYGRNGGVVGAQVQRVKGF
jgi:hypothetical protein